MSLHFLSLHPNSIERVYNFLDDKGLMRFREVCKSTKGHVDEFILNTKQTVIGTLTICREKMNKEIMLKFALSNRQFLHLWKIKVLHVVSKLKDIDVEVREGIYLKILSVTIKLEKMHEFLHFLKTSVHKINILEIEIGHNQDKIIRSFLEFLEGRTVNVVYIWGTKNEEKLNFNQWFDTIVKLNVTRFHCYAHLTKDSVDFLLRMADIASLIRFYVFELIDFTPVMFNLVRAILSRKCRILHIFDHYRRAVPELYFTLADAEKLIKHFQHSGKTVTYYGQTDVAPMNAQIGEYNVEIDDAFEYIWITHMDQKYVYC